MSQRCGSRQGTEHVSTGREHDIVSVRDMGSASLQHPYQCETRCDAPQQTSGPQETHGTSARCVRRSRRRDDDRPEHRAPVAEPRHLVRDRVRSSSSGRRRIGARRHGDRVGRSLDVHLYGRTEILHVDAGLQRDVVDLRRARGERDEARRCQAHVVGAWERVGSCGHDRRDGGRLVPRGPQGCDERPGEKTDDGGAEEHGPSPPQRAAQVDLHASTHVRCRGHRSRVPVGVKGRLPPFETS